MNNFFVYSYRTEDVIGKPITCLVVFCPYMSIERYAHEFKQQLKDYFIDHLSPDEIYVIGSEYHRKELMSVFHGDRFQVFDAIPHFHADSYAKAIFIFTFQKNGDLVQLDSNEVKDPAYMRNVLRRGMVSIFNQRGGLIVAQGSHHFVFSKGKHCDRFLRTGNVLVNGAEILFIVHQLLKYVPIASYENIYCDTSSINSLAFALIEVRRRFDPDIEMPQIESFGSYEVFEQEQFRGAHKSLFLISASTSGSIVRRMVREKKGVEMNQLVVIYGLMFDAEYKGRVVCDLSYDANENPDGILPFTTYNVGKGTRCELCAQGSTGVDVHGDVFLLEKPVIRNHVMVKSDAPQYLNKFAETFRSDAAGATSVLKCFHGESTPDWRYELFIDVPLLLQEWPKKGKGTPKRYKDFFIRLRKHVRDYIPASVRYLIYLPDEGSKHLASIIREILLANKVEVDEDRVIGMDEIHQIDAKDTGVIVVVSSCIVMGKNLLYLSRALRPYHDTMSVVYFTAISRSPYKGHTDFLRSNIGQGEFGSNTHRVVNVMEVYCSDMAHRSPWHIELEFAKKLQEYFEENDPVKYKEATAYFQEREEILNKCRSTNGLSMNLFFPHPTLKKELKIRKGFVFAAGKDFEKHASQSDVYFIVSTVLNHLRHSADGNHQLSQTEYVRNLIAPANFIRFNDGIIQASLLRAARMQELRYDLDETLSYQMKSMLGDMINRVRDEHGEGLTEFFYAIATGKLRMVPNDVHDCIELLREREGGKGDMPVLMALCDYIVAEVCSRAPLHETFGAAPIKN